VKWTDKDRKERLGLEKSIREDGKRDPRRSKERVRAQRAFAQHLKRAA
jgi:hypothetical protein